MTESSVLLLNLGVIFGAVTTLWLVSLPLRNSSIVDIFWGCGFVLVAWTTLASYSPMSSRGILVTIIVSLWGLRLSGYLAWRNIGKGEDYRYQAMRDKVGPRFPLVSLFVVFWLQGLIMAIVVMPVVQSQFSDAPLNWLDGLGVGVWAIGWLCETIGDWQLARFKSQPENQGKVMDRGLWRYTRHPNYFGDFMVWWGLYLIAASGGAAWTIFSPLLMSFLLLRVSGVALLERSMTKKRPGYADYVARTSSFFPWPPRQA